MRLMPRSRSGSPSPSRIPMRAIIGGGGFMLIRLADGRTTFLDFRERAPGAASRNMYLDASGKATQDSIVGYRASGVPGTVSGFEYASKKYGKKPWADVVRPAVELASKGFPISYAQAQSFQTASRLLSRFPESNRIFLRGGKFYEPGETFVQPELARTLDRIMRTGAKDFYEGETARILAKDMQEHGGLITLDDLKAYRTIERKPMSGMYRGYEHRHLAAAQLRRRRHPGDARDTRWHRLREGRRRLGLRPSTTWPKPCGAISPTAPRHLGDPDFVKVPLSSLLDPAYIAKRRASIDPERATPSSEIHAAKFESHESNETTHYSVADADGNVAIVTYTLNGGYGSKVTAEGLGFLLNNEMDDFAPKPGEANMFGLIQGEANAIQPHKTPLSSMTPTIVLEGRQAVAGPRVAGWPDHHQYGARSDRQRARFRNERAGRRQLAALPPPVDAGRTRHGAGLFARHRRHSRKARLHREKRRRRRAKCAAIRFDNGWLEGAADPRTEGTAEGH